jgi:hypothetical protein
MMSSIIQKSSCETQQLHESDNLANLCSNSDFAQITWKWIGLQHNQEHNNTNHAMCTTSCTAQSTPSTHNTNSHYHVHTFLRVLIVLQMFTLTTGQPIWHTVNKGGNLKDERVIMIAVMILATSLWTRNYNALRCLLAPHNDRTNHYRSKPRHRNQRYRREGKQTMKRVQKRPLTHYYVYMVVLTMICYGYSTHYVRIENTAHSRVYGTTEAVITRINKKIYRRWGAGEWTNKQKRWEERNKS